MSEPTAFETLPGTVLMIGNKARDCLDRALERDDPKAARALIEDAHSCVTAMIDAAKAATAARDGSHE